jgi:hypothetical protein
MRLSKIYSLSEVKECVELYYNLGDHNFVNANKEYWVSNLSQAVLRNKFVRVIKQEEKIIAWMWADKVQLAHNPEPIFQQLYYASNTTGFTSFRCVKLLHEALLDEARRLKLSSALSMSSHEDEDFTFTRMLERLGWERRGYIAIYKLNST